MGLSGIAGKGGTHIPSNCQPYLSLMDNCIYEVQSPQKSQFLSNFHPKVWIIKETNREEKNDQQIKVIVMSRNLTLDNNLDMVVSLTGKIGKQTINNKKHKPLIDFLTSLIPLMGNGTTNNQHIIKDKKKKMKMVIESIRKVKHFEIDTDLFEKDGYEFIPILFGQNLNKHISYPEAWQGIRKEVNMDMYTFTMVTSCIISLCILGWLYTKPGQKWLDGFK